MTSIEELSAQIEEEVELKLEMIVGLCRPYLEAREQEAIYKRQKDRLGALIKHYLERHQGEEVWDGENRIVALMKDRKLPGRDYDVLSLYENDPVLFERLLKTGCLKVDDAAVKRAGQNVGGAERYAYPQMVGQYLEVKAIKELTPLGTATEPGE